ncbi:xylosyl- and glucuronyltransferase LARGE2-like [Glandiceps talaboti]
MPHVRWVQDIDCDVGQFGVCRKVLSVNCKPDSVRAIYQYIPIQTELPIQKLYFSVKSGSVEMKVFEGMENSATYDAIALVKFTDGKQELLKLDFPAGTHTYLEADYEFKIPYGKQLTSITVMLGCYGYTGIVKFLAVTVRPILSDEIKNKEIKRSDFVPLCPKPSIPGNHVNTQFVTEKIIESDTKQDADDITLVTQVSMDRIDVLEKSLEYWNGPMSIVLFVPTKSETKDTDHEWKRYYINKKLNNPKFTTQTIVTAVYANTVNDEYPVNYLRNLAIKQCQTTYMLLLDADFIPSPGFREKFKSHLTEGIGMNTLNHIALVVPVFEFTEGLEDLPQMPETKEELHGQLFGTSPKILPFHILLNNEIHVQISHEYNCTYNTVLYYNSPESHRATDYNRWYGAKDSYPVTMYQDKYEPYIVLKKRERMPYYDERFTGYGMNKVTHVMELLAAGYELAVLPDVWAIHIPHRSTTYSMQFLQDPLKRLENRATRFDFVADIMNKYQIGPCQPYR